MTSQTNSDSSYYRHSRASLAQFVPTGENRVLDVGCGAGAFGRLLRLEGKAAEVIGIELNPGAAREAGKHLNSVVHADLNATSLRELPVGGAFDCIVCADVLEHLVDPWGTLRDLNEMLAQDGVVIASIPNVRHWTVLIPLIFMGRWDYVDAGIMDRTHLRFFTKKSIHRMFGEAGLEVASCIALVGGKWRILDRFSLRMIQPFLAVQWVIVARKRTPERH